jgi:hypothetical protein
LFFFFKKKLLFFSLNYLFLVFLNCFNKLGWNKWDSYGNN